EKGNYDLIHPNIHVNMAQSTNDAMPTAIHVATISLIEEVEKAMLHLQQVFARKGAEFDDVIKMGRTHMQDAVPIRLGQEFMAYAKVLGRDLTRLRRGYDGMYEVNLGATAVGTGLNADPTYMKRSVEILATLTHLSLQNADNLVDATQNTDAYTEVSATLKICMINVSKIANDLRFMASGPRAGLA